VTWTTKIEDVFKVGDRVRYKGSEYRVTAVEANHHHILDDEITRWTQWVYLAGLEEPVDASELEGIYPVEYTF